MSIASYLPYRIKTCLSHSWPLAFFAQCIKGTSLQCMVAHTSLSCSRSPKSTLCKNVCKDNVNDVPTLPKEAYLCFVCVSLPLSLVCWSVCLFVCVIMSVNEFKRHYSCVINYTSSLLTTHPAQRVGGRRCRDREPHHDVCGRRTWPQWPARL